MPCSKHAPNPAIPAYSDGASSPVWEMLYWPNRCLKMARCGPMDVVVRDLSELVSPLLEACRKAGGSICDYYHSPGADLFESKGDNTPLTQADLASHEILLRALRRLTPDLPILSEESDAVKFSTRSQWPEFWMVDPLDGTKEFLSRTGEFTINIALISAHRPILGVLYLPLEELAYVGIPGHLALRYQYQEGWQQKPLAVRPLDGDSALKVLASRRHRGPKLGKCLEWLEQEWGPLERLNSGSALKFCQLAEGAGDFYPRFAPCCEWDTAAGQAVLEAAGGALLGMDGLPLTYNRRESLYSPNFYGIGDVQHPLWRALFKERFGEAIKPV